MMFDNLKGMAGLAGLMKELPRLKEKMEEEGSIIYRWRHVQAPAVDERGEIRLAFGFENKTNPCSRAWFLSGHVGYLKAQTTGVFID